jgi:hypothetical protein
VERISTTITCLDSQHVAILPVGFKQDGRRFTVLFLHEGSVGEGWPEFVSRRIIELIYKFRDGSIDQVERINYNQRDLLRQRRVAIYERSLIRDKKGDLALQKVSMDMTDKEEEDRLNKAFDLEGGWLPQPSYWVLPYGKDTRTGLLAYIHRTDVFPMYLVEDQIRGQTQIIGMCSSQNDKCERAHA